MIHAAANGVSTWAGDIGVPLTVALIGALATLAVAALTYTLKRAEDAAARRRNGYAEATRELVAWAEFPYRIRRRTSDDTETLTRLADAGHLLQEALRYRAAWIQTEHRWTAQVFNEVRAAIAAEQGAACTEAWQSQPVRSAGDMVLDGWGPRGVDDHVRRFERAAGFRFGWRRLTSLVGWHPGA